MTGHDRCRYAMKLKRPIFTLAFLFAWQVAFAMVTVTPAFPQAQSQDRFSAQRRRMVDRDLRGRGISDPRVLAAMQAVPRHLFVPENLRSRAYEDYPLPIGADQTISQPYVVAYMSELLQLSGHEKVLEIGTGSGYQTAVLAHLAAEVYSIEIIPALNENARRVLAEMRIGNVYLKVGDGFYGWEEKAPFDAILLTAAAPEVPEPLWRQLRDGGLIIMPMGEAGKPQRLARIRKADGKQHVEKLAGVIFVPMTGAIEKTR
jgi:protein-L-isoaspartate(D-aspartate) O-methyltransferase